MFATFSALFCDTLPLLPQFAWVATIFVWLEDIDIVAVIDHRSVSYLFRFSSFTAGFPLFLFLLGAEAGTRCADVPISYLPPRERYWLAANV